MSKNRHRPCIPIYTIVLFYIFATLKEIANRVTIDWTTVGLSGVLFQGLVWSIFKLFDLLQLNGALELVSLMWNWGNLQLLVGNWSWFRFGCRTDITVYVIGIQVSEVCRDISTLIGFMVRVMLTTSHSKSNNGQIFTTIQQLELELSNKLQTLEPLNYSPLLKKLFSTK